MKKRIVLAIIGVVIVGWCFSAGIWGLGVATAGIYGKGEAHKQIQSADFRIQAYDHFFNLYASIDANQKKLSDFEEQLALYEPGTKEYNMTIVNINGVKSILHDSISQYNYDAQKNWTEGQFRDNDLPYQIQDTF